MVRAFASRCSFRNTAMVTSYAPVYVVLEPVDMRLGIERLAPWSGTGCASSQGRALFVFVSKRGQS